MTSACNTKRLKQAAFRRRFAKTAGTMMILTAAVMAATTLPAHTDDTVAQPISNIQAANGPSPGDLARIQDEWACAQALETPGYFKSLNGAEVADSTRSQSYPCASFLGSLDGPNTVYAWPSADSYQGVLFMNNRRPGELYLTGGNLPPAQGLMPPGPFVAKADATTGRQIWRTYLQNGNVSGEWVGAANLNILPDGDIVIAFGNHLVKLDGDTGLILMHVTLPSGAAPPEGSNFKHVTIAPDGTLIVKNQTRATPCDIQGTLGAFQCPGGAAASPGSTILAIDPETFEIHDQIGVPENAVVPHTITTFDGRIAIYAPSILKAYRFFWDPEAKSLSRDETWAVTYLDEGQTTGDAPGVLGDWIVLQVNGLPTAKAASAIVAINQHDPTRITRVYPFGTDLPTGMSWAPPKAAVDVENGMVFSADQNMMMIGGIKLDQDTGAMTVAWTRDGATTALQALYGPADRRVLGTARAEPGVTQQALMQTSNPTYRQQAIWLDAATGKLLAESDFFEPMNFNTLLSPGFGGRFYYMWDNGFYVLQPMPVRAEAQAKQAEAGPRTTPVDVADTRDMRFCEVLVIKDGMVDIYNTSGLNACPPGQWDAIDPKAMASAMSVDAIQKNGPHFWVMDSQTIGFGETETFNGIDARWAARISASFLGEGGGSTPYEPFKTCKSQKMVYGAGGKVWEMVDADGNAYILQAHDAEFALDDLDDLGARMKALPDGWSWRTRVLDEALVLDLKAEECNIGIGDEFHQYYTLVPIGQNGEVSE